MSAVTRDVAQAEITGWLDKKKVYDSTREEQKGSIDILIEAMMGGDLILNDKFEFTHNLLFPLDGLTELKYAPRLNDVMLRPYLNGVKSQDVDGRLLAYGSALTKTTKRELELLDTADKKIMLAIAVFFL